MKRNLFLLSVVFIATIHFSCSKESENPDDYISPEVVTETVTLPGSTIAINLALVKAGTFLMGCHGEAPYPYDDELPLHKVTLTEDYYISTTEVTQDLYEAVMGNNPSGSVVGEKYPVARVSYYEALQFCENLSTITGRNFSLPSEAQWEYAARGGHLAPEPQPTYAGSNDIDKVAWYKDNSGQEAHPIAQKRPNILGLYDMSGNVYEWCLDKYNNYSAEDQVDPITRNSGYSYYITRGGCYSHSFGPRSCTVSSRKSYLPEAQLDIIGLRIIMMQ